MLKSYYLFKNIWKNVIFDFKQPVSYLIPAVMVTMAGVFLYRICRKKKTKIRPSCVLLIIYIEIVIQTAFFSREPGSRSGIDMQLFGTWGQTAVEHAYFIENIIMFVPFGILVPMVIKKMKKAGFCVLTGFLFSCTIEISQLLTQRGYCQLDDIVTNTAGTLIGWVIWKMMIKIFREGKG